MKRRTGLTVGHALWMMVFLCPLWGLGGAEATGLVSSGAVTLAAALAAPSNLRQAPPPSTPPLDLQLLPAGYGGGGRFTSIAFDGAEPTTLLIGSDVAGIFRSTDAGSTFQLTGSALDGFAVADVAGSPFNPRRMFLLTDEGLYLSDDHGSTWLKTGVPVRYAARHAGSHLIAFSGESIWVASDSEGVFRIPAVGDIQPEKLPGLESLPITSLVLHQETLYAGTLQGVYRHREGRWEPFNAGLTPERPEVVDMIPHPRHGLCLVEKTRGVHALDASAGTWAFVGKPSLEPGTFKALAVSPSNPDLLLLASHPQSWPHRLYKSTDAGLTWRSVESFQADPLSADNWTRSLQSVEEIRFAPHDPSQVWLSDWWNVWRSANAGESWSQVHRGLQNTVINDIKSHPLNPEALYACVSDNGLMVSLDGGASWKRRMNGVLDGDARELEISALNPSKMYLLAQPWGRKDRVFVYRSLDGGLTWQEKGFPVPSQPLPQLPYVDGLATNLELDPTSDDTLYVGTNGYGVFKSTDGGSTWTPSSSGMTTPYIKGTGALVIRPGAPWTLYASTQAGGVYRSTDGAGTWTPVSPAFPFTFGMAVDPKNPNRVLAARPEKRLIVSEDGGSRWKEIALPGDRPAHVTTYAVAISPSDPGRVAVGTLGYDYRAADGLFVSVDGGATFAPCPSALPRVSVNSLFWSPLTGNPLFIGFNGSGLFKGVPL